MSPALRKTWVVVGVAMLVALHYSMAVLSKRGESTTSDELVHVTGGYSYWAFDDYRLQPENGNLPQRWAALPAWLMGTPFPTLDQPYWRVSDVWVMGHEFFYETGADHFPRLMAARAMIGLFSAATALLVFLWSRRLFGTTGAFVSLTLFAFCPSFLAHGGYATSDVCLVFFMLASIGAWWRHLEKPGAGPFALSAAVFGLACVSKFSAVLLVPMMAACAIVHVAARRGRVGRVLLSAAGHAAAAFLVIWTFYGFRYSAFNPAVPHADQFIEAWPLMIAHTGHIGRLIHTLARLRVLPEAFLYGAAYVVETSSTRAAFLNGDYSTTGWPTFFLWVFAYKCTLAFILASAWALWRVLRQGARASAARANWAAAVVPFTPLFALLAVYWASSLTSHLNIGERHLLPTYPPLFILTGVLGQFLTRRTTLFGSFVAGLIAWNTGESVAVAPHYLAYFNELAGGPSEGYRHLVDSSLDWGQDLPGLKAWLEANARPGEPVYLAYFGTGEPSYYRLPVRRLAYLNVFLEDEPYIPLTGGTYCIGATMLEQVYGIPGKWTPALEREYQFLRVYEPKFAEYARDPDARRRLETELPRDTWIRGRNRFQHLRFARLCCYLRVRRPDAVIGYSIFVFRLSDDEVKAATAGSAREWYELISRSGVGVRGP